MDKYFSDLFWCHFYIVGKKYIIDERRNFSSQVTGIIYAADDLVGNDAVHFGVEVEHAQLLIQVIMKCIGNYSREALVSLFIGWFGRMIADRIIFYIIIDIVIDVIVIVIILFSIVFLFVLRTLGGDSL